MESVAFNKESIGVEEVGCHHIWNVAMGDEVFCEGVWVYAKLGAIPMLQEEK